MQLVDVLGQGTAAGLVGFVNDIPHLAVDLGSGGLAVALALAEVTAQEGFLLRGTVHYGAKTLGEAVAGDHLAGDVGGLLQVVGSTGRDILQDQLLGHTAAQAGHDVLEHLALGHIAAVLLRQIHGIAACLPTGDDSDLVHTGVVLAVEARHRMACLVVGGELFLLRGDHAALLLGACHHLHGGFLDILHGNGLAVAAGSQQRGLVDKVLQVCTGKTGGALGDDLQGYIRCQRLVSGMDFQDLLAALDVRQAHIDLAVKAAGAQQRLIQNIGTVGGRHNDDAIVGFKAIHLHQQLVQSLLAFIVSAAQACAALAAHGIDLIDKDDAWHGLFSLIEQIAHTGCAHADIHLHKVGTGDGVEGHPGLTGAGTGQQGLAGARRAYQQHAMGDAGAQGIELFRAFEELHNFLKFLFFLVLTGHIGKGGSLFVLVLVLYLGLAYVHDAAATGTAAHHGEQQEAGAAQHGQVEQDLHPGDALLCRHIVVYHGGIGVGCIVLGDVVRHMIHEHPGVRQLIAHRFGAIVVLGHPGRCRGGQHTGQQPARGLGGALLGGIRQRLGAFLQGHGDHAGIQIQRELGDLVALKIVYHRGICHGGTAGTAAGAAQHRPHHQHRCQHDGQHQRIKAGSFRLQKNQLQFWILYNIHVTSCRSPVSARRYRAGCGIFRHSPGHSPPQTHPAPGSPRNPAGCRPCGG